ncbi:putative very-long-chain 3-oxoacyl-CoA reductase [Helianthus anomalus]
MVFAGHFLLTHLLLDNIKKTTRKSKKAGRIVNVSSEAHRITYPEGIRFDKINDETKYSKYQAYGQSKLANIMHANELTRQLKERRLIDTEEAMTHHMNFCQKSTSPDPPLSPAIDLIESMRRFIRRGLDSPRPSML